MNPKPGVAVVAGHLAGWCIVISFVILLTLIFNFLGTIICAALAGMMMGSARLPRRHCLLASLIFPAVVSLVLRLWRAELAPSQIVALSILCFGVFWAIWGTMWLLCGTPPPSTFARKQENEPSQSLRQGRHTVSAQVASSMPLPAATAPTQLDLASLQGLWCPQREGAPAGKLLRFDGPMAVLTCFSEKGEIRSKAEAEVQLRPAHPLGAEDGATGLLPEFSI